MIRWHSTEQFINNIDANVFLSMGCLKRVGLPRGHCKSDRFLPQRRRGNERFYACVSVKRVIHCIVYGKTLHIIYIYNNVLDPAPSTLQQT